MKANHTLAYPDALAIAIALAQEVDGAIVTGDPEFRRVQSWVSVRWLER